MNRVGEHKRKVRSDKKRDIKPTIEIDLKDAIYRLSYITHTPVKNVAEFMVMNGINNKDIINVLSKSFRREVRIDNTLYRGVLTNPRIVKRQNIVYERITLRLTHQTYEMLSVLAYALDVSASRVCALLLDASMRDFQFINEYVNRYLTAQLTPNQMKEMRSILQYVNEGADDKITLATLLSSIANEVSTPISRVKDAVNEFIIHYWDE